MDSRHRAIRDRGGHRCNGRIRLEGDPPRGIKVARVDYFLQLAIAVKANIFLPGCDVVLTRSVIDNKLALFVNRRPRSDAIKKVQHFSCARALFLSHVIGHALRRCALFLVFFLLYSLGATLLELAFLRLPSVAIAIGWRRHRSAQRRSLDIRFSRCITGSRRVRIVGNALFIYPLDLYTSAVACPTIAVKNTT